MDHIHRRKSHLFNHETLNYSPQEYSSRNFPENMTEECNRPLNEMALTDWVMVCIQLFLGVHFYTFVVQPNGKIMDKRVPMAKTTIQKIWLGRHSSAIETANNVETSPCHKPRMICVVKVFTTQLDYDYYLLSPTCGRDVDGRFFITPDHRVVCFSE